MKIQIVIVIFAVFFVKDCFSSCGTPVECYQESMKLLSQDRAEFRRVIEKNLKDLEAAEETMNSTIEKLRKEMQNSLENNNKLITDLQNKFTEEQKTVDIKIKNLKITPADCKWVEEPIHTGWNQAMCPTGYYVNGGGHFTMPREVDDERIRVYCCRMIFV